MMTKPICKRCRKRSYKTEKEAIHAALSSSRSFGHALRIYRCPISKHGYHLTTRK